MSDVLTQLPAVDAGPPPDGCGPLLPGGASAAWPLRQALFASIRAHGRISRSDAAKALGVSPGSVTSASAELIDLGLVEEVRAPQRDGDGGRGRPPVALGVTPGGGCVAGIKIGDYGASAVILDRAGRQLAEAELFRSNRALELAGLLDEVEGALGAVCRAGGIDAARITAVGLGVPGYVDARSGEVLWCPLIAARAFNLRDLAIERLGVPVHVDNDANLVTLAELWFGKWRRRNDFAVVTIEHGVGMGLVLNHQLYRGAQGIGTELGHIKVQLDGALCRCGQRGCLEAYVADYALVREASTALNWTMERGQSPNVLLESLYDHAKAGNTAARSIFRRAGRYLALGLSTVSNLFDLELIVLSGERLKYDYLYAAEVIEEMESLTINSTRPKPEIEINAWGGFVWARGAAALALQEETERLLGASACV